MKITANELLSKFLDFFKQKNHVIIPSASLIPQNDPTVLFNTAGMQPLIPYLLGQKHPLGTRLVDVQKCLRTVDFDNIGDNTHHTFFQMLGNWSLGDYFKKESITWSFEFLTNSKWLGIEKEKLAFTVYQGDSKIPKDDESANLWIKQGVKKERIAYLDAENNFWSAGETGPCGPDTEIFYWTGKDSAPSKFDPSDNRWVEIWNNVFMQYNRLQNGKVEPLSEKNIDTGMGLERTLAIISGKESAYETDLFFPVIEEISKLTNKDYNSNKKEFRIIADHIRAATFLIADGCIPSNTDQGYVLRRLIRRAIKFGNSLGLTNNFTEILAKEFISIYKAHYPELVRNKQKIIDELNKEEIKFKNTLVQGLKEFDKLIKNKNKLSEEDAFLLFQSYGFPIEMTAELAKEKGFTIDVNAIKEKFKKHQEASKKGSEQKFKSGLADTSETTIKLHTATHLLHSALHKVLGKEVQQKGSNITPERLRFDFNYSTKLTSEQIKKIEDLVNESIKKEIDVKLEELSPEEAKKQGAIGLFGDKYGEKVSVYTIGNVSKEICTGPHVRNTKELKHFKIIKEEAVAAGIRRIKATIE